MTPPSLPPLEVLRDFPGRSIGQWRWDGPTLYAELEREPLVHADGDTHDYSLHFVMGLRNTGDSVVLAKATVSRDEGNELSHSNGRIYASDRPDQEFVLATEAALTDHQGSIEWTVEMGPGETRYWSNTMWRPLSVVTNLFGRLADEAGLTAEVLGESIQGRPIVAYYDLIAARDQTRPTVLITSGLHPVEADTIGTEAILEWLIEDGRWALGRFNIVLVPVANPDSFVETRNGCNAAGVNFFWDFRADDPKLCPEAFHLWRFIKRMPPVVYIDFHSYSVQGSRKLPGPYRKPELLHWDRATRELASDMFQSLNEIPGTRPQSLFAPSTLAYRITREMNTITIAKYHLHQDQGKAQMKRMSVNVVERLLNILKESRVSGTSILAKPYGPIARTPLTRAVQAAYRARYLYPKRVRKALSGITGT